MHKFNPFEVISHLRDVLGNLNWSSHECIMCNWVDHADFFTSCRVCDSYVCKDCNCRHSENGSTATSDSEEVEEAEDAAADACEYPPKKRACIDKKKDDAHVHFLGSQTQSSQHDRNAGEMTESNMNESAGITGNTSDNGKT